MVKPNLVAEFLFDRIDTSLRGLCPCTGRLKNRKPERRSCGRLRLVPILPAPAIPPTDIASLRGEPFAGDAGEVAVGEPEQDGQEADQRPADSGENGG